MTAAVNLPNNAIPGGYSININTQDVSGTPQHALTIAVTVNQDFTIGSLTPATQTINARAIGELQFQRVAGGCLVCRGRESVMFGRACDFAV